MDVLRLWFADEPAPITVRVEWSVTTPFEEVGTHSGHCKNKGPVQMFNPTRKRDASLSCARGEVCRPKLSEKNPTDVTSSSRWSKKRQRDEGNVKQAETHAKINKAVHAAHDKTAKIIAKILRNKHDITAKTIASEAGLSEDILERWLLQRSPTGDEDFAVSESLQAWIADLDSDWDDDSNNEQTDACS